MVDEGKLEDFECCVLNEYNVCERKSKVLAARTAHNRKNAEYPLPANLTAEFENNIRSIGLKVQIRRGVGVICPHYDNGRCRLNWTDCYAVRAV